MSKLKSAILYEYSTKIKAMVLFYLIQYLIVALIFRLLQSVLEVKKLDRMR